MKTTFRIVSLSLMLICGGTAFAQDKGYDKGNMPAATGSRRIRCATTR